MHGSLAGTDAARHGARISFPQSAQNDDRADRQASRSPIGVQAGFRFCAIAAVLGLLISLFFVGGRLLPQRTAAAERAGA